MFWLNRGRSNILCCVRPPGFFTGGTSWTAKSRRHWKPWLGFFALIATLSPVVSPERGIRRIEGRPDRSVSKVIDGVDTRRKLAQVMSDTVFSFGELAYQEFETSKYLTGVLEKNGFTVERGVAGIPTAWVARWGSGHPVIALGSDIECSSEGLAKTRRRLSRAAGRGSAGPWRGPQLRPGRQHRGGARRQRFDGTRKASRHADDLAGRREEFLGAKAYLVRAGMFRDVDAVLFTHVGDTFQTSWGAAPGHRPGFGRIHVRGRVRPCGRPAMARPQRAARRRADEHRLGFRASSCVPSSAPTT